jgi:hypothetical protein
MLPPPEKNIFKISKKKINKKLSMYVLTFYVHVQVSRKTDIFCDLYKKIKKMSRVTPILAPKFVFLHTTQKMSFFV